MKTKDEVVTKGFLEEVMKSHTDEIVGVIHTFMNQVEDRMTAQDLNNEKRFDKLERKSINYKMI